MHGSPEERRHWLRALEQPLALAGTTLPNRLMMSALTLQYATDGLISERHLAFYSERARGEVGLLFSEQLVASPLSESPFIHSLRAYDGRQIAQFQKLAAILRPFDTKFFAQLFSAGAAGVSTIGISHWAPLRAPSEIAVPTGEPPSSLTGEEISRLIRDYAHSARNVREGRLHGIEIHGAHGWLVGQFLSPFYNRRADQYGGSVDNRCRLALEIGTAIRSEVGADFPLGISLTYDELIGSQGITPEDTLEQLRVLGQPRIFDYFDLSIGSSHQQHHTIAPMSVPEGYSLPFAARARQVVHGDAAIFTSGRIRDVYMAGRAIFEAQADGVGMARALVADPYLLPRTRDAEGKGATRCVGANYCVARALTDQPVTCVVNPRAGRESEWQPVVRTATPLRITVIGGGPAGLRFAVVASQAGHEVTVIERKGQAGGHLATLSRLPTRESWAEAIHDMTATLQAAGARLLLQMEATADGVLKSAPDAIVVATGSSWVIPENLIARRAMGLRVLTLEVAIEHTTEDTGVPFGRHTLITDATGTYGALGLADFLSALGIRVTLLTRNESLGHIAALELSLQHVMPRLARRGVQSIVAHRLVDLAGDRVILESIWGGSFQEVAGVDCVVICESRAPDNELWKKLRGRHSRVYCIGDAVSPRSTAAVIYEAELLARLF